MLTDKKGTVLVVAVTAMMIMIIIGLVCLQIYTNQSLLDTYDQVRQRTFYSAEAGIEMMRGYIDKKVEENLVPVGGVAVNVGDAMYGCRGFLAYVTRIHGVSLINFDNTTVWEPFKEGTTSPYPNAYLKEVFDGTMHPKVDIEVTLHRLNASNYVDVHDDRHVYFKYGGAPIDDKIFFAYPSEAFDINAEYRGYEIRSVATAVHNTTMGSNTIKTTLRYYFYTKRIPQDLGEGVTRFENRIFWVGWRQD